jgi:hypothetical protein
MEEAEVVGEVATRAAGMVGAGRRLTMMAMVTP